MDERLLATLGLIWTILNICYTNSRILEDSALQKTCSNLSRSPDEFDSSISTQDRIGLSVCCCCLFLGLILVRHTHNLATQAIRSAENTELETADNSPHSFFSQHNTNDSSDNSSSEEEDQTHTPKKIN